MSVLSRVLQPTQLSVQPSLDKSTMHPAFPDIAAFSIQKWWLSLRFWVSGWVTNHHRTVNLGETEPTAPAVWTAIAPGGTDTLRPLYSAKLTRHICMYFCNGGPRSGILVPQIISTLWLPHLDMVQVLLLPTPAHSVDTPAFRVGSEVVYSLWLFIMGSKRVQIPHRKNCL